MNDILSQLNTAQRQAASHIDGALLILAGAGSGKTKTITTRLAYLIQDIGIPPESTLTLTFTNKAATEMRSRALALLGGSISHPPLLCTFHKFGLIFLREYIRYIGREHNFTLIDTDDQKRIIKKLDNNYLQNLNIAQILGFISAMKNRITTAQMAKTQATTPQYKLLAQAYYEYEEFLLRHNMLDFDDLLLLSYEVLHSHNDIALESSTRYQYIMVDEYQDTNLLQVSLLQKLCSTHNNLCVVGDDDQSIYSWRGADISHILSFAKTFNAQTITLTENYRSKEPILRAANTLIAHNTSRLGKNLISTRGEGEEIELLTNADEVDEANTIAKRIQALLDSGKSAQDIAILFRLNALSRSIEEGLNRAKIPYKLIGATRFYERAEIKDVLAYFHLILNPNDDFSLSRIINVPKRGIGKVTQEKLFSHAAKHNLSVYEAFKQGVLTKTSASSSAPLSPTQKAQLQKLFDTIEVLQTHLEKSPITFLDAFDEIFALRKEQNSTPDDIDRRANIEEFYGYFRDFFMQNPHYSLQDLFYELSLSSSTDVEVGDSVSCMSVHSSKGLEFAYVFIVGCEEGFFPLLREEGDLQEERRLAYVAFTRARERLFLSHTHSRFYRGKRESLGISRFVKEAGLKETGLKVGLIKHKTPESSEIVLDSTLDSNSTHSSDSSELKKGDAIKHKIFGIGLVQEVQKLGGNVRVRVNFGGNVRVLLAEFLQKI